MDRATLEKMLTTPGLGLDVSGDRVEIGSDRPLTLTLIAGGEAMRFGKVEALDLGPVEVGLLGLERESSYLVVEVAGVVAMTAWKIAATAANFAPLIRFSRLISFFIVCLLSLCVRVFAIA